MREVTEDNNVRKKKREERPRKGKCECKGRKVKGNK